ncbi:MAG: amidase [Burkholderiaceae bacterium]
MSQPETVAELADAYAAGLSPREVVERCWQRIDADRELNAFVHEARQPAREAAIESAARWRAGRPRSRLDGVPIAVKDNIAVAAMPWSNGLGALRNRLARDDAEVVRRMRSAGMIIMGRLNMHEAALGATTDNPHFGATHNPLRHGFTAGGSSGGSGAAVAAGLVPIALGTDTMGSVRIPAAYCGCVGLLPARGRVSRHGVAPLSDTLDQVGILARTVDDAAMLLSVIAGHDPRDLQSSAGARVAPVPVAGPPRSQGGTSTERARSSGSPRVALFDGGPSCEPSIRRALDAFADRLRALGWSLQPRDSLPADSGVVRRAGLLISEREGYAASLPWLRREGVSDTLRRMLAYGASQPAARIHAARQRLIDAGRCWQACQQDLDAWLLPTTPQRAFALTDPVPPDQADLTVHANVAGWAAISLPVPARVGGLPCGVQLMMPAAREHELLRLAARIAPLTGNLDD